MLLSENVQRFFDFVTERHAIYLRRARGDPWPWTNDPILQAYKFTNIFRELDTGTVHCRKMIREPYANHEELFFNVASYRLYNNIETQKEIGFVEHYNPIEVMELMYRRQARGRGERVFTGAHMITGTLGGDKIYQVFYVCLGNLWDNRRLLEPKPGDTLEIAFNRLNKHNPGYGPFITYEVITDLRHTRYLQDATDIYTWANPGPGAQRGINRLLGNVVRTKSHNVLIAEERSKYPKKTEYLEYMRLLLALSRSFTPKWVPDMEMRDIEHSLCEFDKYERVRLGQGKPRSRFIPPHLRQV